MGVVVGNIEFHCGPTQLGAPDDLEAVIVDFIDKAQKKLEIAVQELENLEIAEAIFRAKRRKVQVTVLLEQSYLRRGSRVGDTTKTQMIDDPFLLLGPNEENRAVQNAAFRLDIDLKIDFNPRIFHQKFIVRDGVSVLTGSTNFTPTGTEKNLNHVVIINDEHVAKLYRKEFGEMRKGRFGRHKEWSIHKPKEIDVSGVTIKALFSPEHGPEMEIMKQMLKAKQRIDFAIFTFAKSSGIDDTMKEIRNRPTPLPIKGAMDAAMANRDWAASHHLKPAGVEIHLVKKKGRLGKLHHKLMVIDDQVVIAGSFNYTGPANMVNDENIIVIGDLETESAETRALQTQIALFARQEIDRIIEDHGQEM